MRLIKIRDDNGKTILVGKVIDGVLYMERHKSKHLYKKFNGWGVDAKVVEGLDDVHTLQITEKEELQVYRVGKQTFIAMGERIHFGGHREQIVLPLSEWSDK